MADSPRTRVPDPAREDGPDTTIQLADETTLQVHPSTVVTTTSTDVAAAPTESETGVRTNEQAVPGCVSRTATSLMRMSACRAAAVGFGPVRNWICPLPWPDVGERSVIQLACVAAVHAHSGGAETLIVDRPPDAGTPLAGGAEVAAHLSTDGPSVVVDDRLHVAAIRAATNRIVTAGQRTGPYRDGRWGDRAGSMAVRIRRGTPCLAIHRPFV